MWKTALKQIWKNRKSNVWIFLEILVVSVLMWYCIDFLYVVVRKNIEPMGVNTEHVYRMQLGRHFPHEIDTEDTDTLTHYIVDPLDQILQIVSDYPGVESVTTYLGTEVYTQGSMFQGYTSDDDYIHIASIRYVGERYSDVFKVKMLEGDFSDWDSHGAPQSAVLSPELADSLFRTSSVVGRTFRDYYAPELSYRVSGVSTSMKYEKYSRYEPFIYTPIHDGLKYALPNIAFRVSAEADDTTFVSRFMSEMRSKLNIGPYYLFSLFSYDFRAEVLDTVSGIQSYINVIVCLIIFFLFIIFVGLLGTFWFQVESRRNEIGLRMALGSSHRGILIGFLREGLVLFLTAYIPALLITMCLAYWEITYTINDCMDYTWTRYAVTQVITGLVVMGIVVQGCLFPARRAAKLHPVEALRDE